MVQKQEFYFPSADGLTVIRAVRYLPDGEIKAVLQLLHGMSQCCEDYGECAEFFAERGFKVVISDILGHGRSLKSVDDLAFFAEKDGWEILCRDQHELYLAEMMPDTPYFMMGHSLGSFILRSMLAKYDEKLAGCIVTGTTDKPKALLVFGKIIADAAAFFTSKHAVSPLLNHLAFGKYKLKFGGTDYIPTVGLSCDLMEGMRFVQKRSSIESVNKKTPILFMSGALDAVSCGGKEVYKAAEKLKKAGCERIEVNIIPNCRHTPLLDERRRDFLETMYETFKSFI